MIENNPPKNHFWTIAQFLKSTLVNFNNRFKKNTAEIFLYYCKYCHKTLEKTVALW